MKYKFSLMFLFAFLLLIIICFPTPALATPWTPIEWQDNGKLTNWIRDRNGNFVDDLIEEQTGAVDVIVDLNKCVGDPNTSQFIQYLNTLGDVSYVGKYLSFAIVTGVDVQPTFDIAQRPEVAMVELDVPLKWLDTERQAMKVQSSTEYPNNLTKKGWPSSLNGNGVNIAILDSGVDDINDSELKGKFKYGYNAMTGKEENPSGGGHGTFMARFALGTGDVGIAPKAGLVDIKIGSDLQGATHKTIMQGLEKVLEKRKDWNIKVVNLSFTYSWKDPSLNKNDGKEAMSWLVNRISASGITVAAAAGNGASQGDKEIKPPGTASLAMTVGAADPGSTVSRADDVVTSTYGPRNDDGDQDKLDELKPEFAVSSDSGTSPATARTSGLAALLIQKAPDITPGSLKDLLIRTAENRETADTSIKYPKNTPTWNKKWGFGLVDAFAAVDNLQKANAPDLTFQGYDNSAHPSTPWYFSRAIRIKRQGKEVDNIVDKQLHTIAARVINKSSQAANNVRVNFAFYQFTAGIPEFHDIGSYFISTIKGQGIVEASIDWTPPKLEAGKENEHGCILVTIDYGYDSNFTKMSNFAQRNLQVKTTSSPAIFNFLVENPLPHDAKIELKVNKERPDWKINLSETSFTLANYDCAKTIQAIVEPPPGVTPGTEALFFVTAYATEVGQEQAVDIGGVALKARFEEMKNEIRDDA